MGASKNDLLRASAIDHQNSLIFRIGETAAEALCGECREELQAYRRCGRVFKLLQKVETLTQSTSEFFIAVE